ncbi:Efflux pump membrane transporter BepE [Anatilimnocola aggregata]|uniref:Efflux pump membrane transporter BepE n=1 Tax=Anatilimnocola aggregata TaxID=2528021 RepID=A0A517YHS9_9BACT|nr:multidrug efflux RND transporter permease subunit [Anatilimnocola aggregata]QDU29769.1 Efflux pump membrane transporter BepE [Anatilimnocola aggregata]
MFSKFFIDRPIFANVIAIVTMLVGVVALLRLPVEQYPGITPPTVVVTGVYPGANARVVSDTVASPVEQQVNGVEGMLYMSSTCSSDGTYTLTVTFEIGTDLDEAQVLVQNRVSIAEPQLPEEVRRQGVMVKKQSTNFILVCALTSEGNRYDSIFLSNFCNLRLRDEISRIPGVGDVVIFGGSNYSMRVWLDPEKIKARNMTTQDVIAAIQEQNVQVAAGQIGQPPSPSELNFQYIVTAMGRLSSAEQFGDIVIKSEDQGRILRLKDVAKIELGAQTYDQFSLLNGSPSASLGVFQLPGANALKVSEGVREAIHRLESTFPEGLKVTFPFDTTKFVDAAIHEVYKTLIEAGVLVLVVILVFLQDWRAVLIPATTVPVTLIGAFAAMAALGFSVNMLTLFGLVLAIGIVVDDAIVIVEAAAHGVERGLAPRDATIKAMDQVLGPIIGITLVLLAVFIPTAFLGGVTGQLYRQFALTIAATALISAINAVTLKPAQCALWLRKPPEKKNFFYHGFNWVYDRVEGVYTLIVRRMLRVSWAVMLVFAALIAATGWWYNRVPTGFLPTEDQGYFVCAIQLPDAASQSRTAAVVDKVNAILADIDGVSDWFAIGGMSLLDNSSASNAATIFVVFDGWDKRKDPQLSQAGILGTFYGHVSKIDEAVIFAFPPPAIPGLGQRAGFTMQVEDRADVGPEELQFAVQSMLEAGREQPALDPTTLNSMFRAGVPQLYINVDRVKVKTLDVPLTNVFSTLQAYLGSAYVNDFNRFGRTFQVRVQAEQKFRVEPRDIERLEVRNRAGQMIPLGSVVDVKRSFGPQILTRYNLYPSAQISGSPAAMVSSGQAIALMEQMARDRLPQSMGYEWTDMSYQEKKVGGESIYIFAFAVLLVYLVLAAQYESWITPLAVILVVPLGVLGAIAAVSLRGFDNNIFTQIGIVLIIALASKNAILIVEYARDLRNEGHSIFDSAVEAARLRFRPILMTSFAFILGVVPLVIADGAGAAGQQALGTAVFGGMLASTILAVFFVPVFFLVFQHVSEWWRPRASATLGGASGHSVAVTAPAVDAQHEPNVASATETKPAH